MWAHMCMRGRVDCADAHDVHVMRVCMCARAYNARVYTPEYRVREALDVFVESLDVFVEGLTSRID